MEFMIFLLVCSVVGLFFYIREQAKTVQQLGKRLGELEKRTEPPSVPVEKVKKTEVPTPVLVPRERNLESPKKTTVKTAPALAIPVKSEAKKSVPMTAGSERPQEPKVNPSLPFLKDFSLEQFLGVKLLAWIGGVILFLAVVFFIKYSFDQGLIGPRLRIVLGYLLSMGLMAGGVFLAKGRYEVVGKTLVGTGILLFYAITLAAQGLYHLIPLTVAFLLMSINTVSALVLSVVLNAPSIAILGFLGGFLTPPLLSTGEDRPWTLFSYVALLDVGLVLVALKKRWSLMILLAASATVIMLWGWSASFLNESKMNLTMTLFLGFQSGFAILAWIQNRRGMNAVTGLLGSVLPAVGIVFLLVALFANHLQDGGYPGFLETPHRLFLFMILADLLVVLPVWFQPVLRLAGQIMGACLLLLLTWWLGAFLKPENQIPALVMIVLLGTLHTLGTFFVGSRSRTEERFPWTLLFSGVSFLMFLFPLVGRAGQVWGPWVGILTLMLIAGGLAFLLKQVRYLILAFGAVCLLAMVWILDVPSESPASLPYLVIILLFALLFTAAWVYLVPIFGKKDRDPLPGKNSWIVLLPSLMPSMLLTMVLFKMPFEAPHALLGTLGAYFIILCFLTYRSGNGVFLLTALISSVLVGYSWTAKYMGSANALSGLLWLLGLSSILVAYPFLFLRGKWEVRLPWITSALVYPIMGFPIFACAHERGWTSWAGAQPLILAVPLIAAFLYVLKATKGAAPADRTRLLALYAGTALYFVTLAIPLQFRKEWITVGWALEGAALMWLYTRVPHPGLKWTGMGLFLMAFIRLTLNPSVFDYHPRSDRFFFNFYAYTYGLPVLALIATAWVTRGKVLLGSIRITAATAAMAAILAFLLLNIEIADYFSTGSHLTFRFSGSLGQDMTYSIAWGLFAMGVLAAGFRWQHAITRYIGLGLLIVTLLKLFLHDLFRLGGLYRIGSLIGLAVVLIALSFAYAKFFSPGTKTESRK